jgi:hypothetical protein
MHGDGGCLTILGDEDAAMPFRLLMSVALSSVAAIVTPASAAGPSAQVPRTLVAVLAYADDEGTIAPVVARYARDGVQVLFR